MRMKRMVCTLIGAWILTGCSSMAPVAVAPATAPSGVDYARMAAVEQNARYLGVQVIWVKQPELRQPELRQPELR